MEGVAFKPGSGSDSEDPFVELRRIVDDLEKRGLSVDEYTPVVAEHMVEKVLDNFELERGFKQGPFPPLSGETLRRRRAGGKGAKMLQDTSIMKGSIMPASEGNVAEAFSNNPYIKYHVSHEPRTKIPLRDVFDIDILGVADYACEVILSGIAEGGAVPA